MTIEAVHLLTIVVTDNWLGTCITIMFFSSLVCEYSLPIVKFPAVTSGEAEDQTNDENLSLMHIAALLALLFCYTVLKESTTKCY